MEKLIFVRSYCFTVLMICSLVQYGQEKPLLETEAIKSVACHSDFFAEDETGVYYSITKEDKADSHFFIEKRSQNSLELIFSKEIGTFFKGKNKGDNLVNCFLFYKKLYCFYSYHVKDTIYLMLQMVSVSGDVSEPYNLKKYGGNLGSLSVEMSPDNNSFACVWIGSGSKCSDPSVSVYNTSTLGIIWEKNILQQMSNGTRVKKLAISNNNTICFVANYNGPKMYVAHVNSPTLKVITGIVDDNIDVVSASVKVLSDGNFMYSGVFGGKNVGAKGFADDPGFFVNVIDPETLEIKYRKDYPFSGEILDKLSKGTPFSKVDAYYINTFGEDHFSGFTDPVILESNNFIYITTENYFREANQYAALQQKDLVVLKIDKNGGQKAMSIIPKKNIITIDIVLPELFIQNDRLFVFFLETPAYASQQFNEYESAIMEVEPGIFGNVVLASENEQNGFDKRILFKNSRAAFNYRFFYHRKIVLKNGKLILVGEETRSNSIKYLQYNLSK